MTTNAVNTTHIHDDYEDVNMMISAKEYIGLRDNLEQIYEAVAGDDAINRYTHEEIIDRIYEMYDCYQYVVDNVYSKGEIK